MLLGLSRRHELAPWCWSAGAALGTLWQDGVAHCLPLRPRRRCPCSHRPCADRSHRRAWLDTARVRRHRTQPTVRRVATLERRGATAPGSSFVPRAWRSTTCRRHSGQHGSTHGSTLGECRVRVSHRALLAITCHLTRRPSSTQYRCTAREFGRRRRCTPSRSIAQQCRRFIAGGRWLRRISHRHGTHTLALCRHVGRLPNDASVVGTQFQHGRHGTRCVYQH